MSVRPRILLADDHPDMVKAVSRLLALDCEIVGSVADGSALLQEAQRLRPDVMVLDANLPNVHSLEACREITRVNPTTKVIVFTFSATCRHRGLRLSLPSPAESDRHGDLHASSSTWLGMNL